MNRSAFVCTSIATLGIVVAALVTAGPLDPPAGPVTPTYKTLTEVEPRIAINAVNTPGDATSIYRITQPGSYYLAGNIPAGAAGRLIIAVAASNVTIDLCGFEIEGQIPTGGRSPFGIALDNASSPNNVTIRNGTVRGCGTGIYLAFGQGSGDTYVVEGVKLLGNESGLYVAFGSVVRGCHIAYNEQGGIFIGSGLVESCVVYFNGGTGIDAGGSSVIRHCAVSGNGGRGISAALAVVSGCSTSGNAGGGILAYQSTLEGCTTTDGVELVDDCVARGNRCSRPNNTAMLVSGSDNRVEGNMFTDSSIGLGVIDPGNIIIRNTASGNAINWTIVAGNALAPIRQASTNASTVTGNAYAGSLGSTDPNANFTY